MILLENHPNFWLYTDYEYKYRINKHWKNISSINYEYTFNDPRLELTIKMSHEFGFDLKDFITVRTKWFKNLVLLKNIKIDEKVIKDVFYYKYNQNISLKNYGYLDNKIIRFDEKTTNKYYSIMKDHLVFDKEIELIDLYYGFNSDIWYIDESHKIHNKTYKIQKCVKNLRIF